MTVLSVRDLRVGFPGGGQAVDGVSFDLAPGASVALVGESGAGKSVTALALLGLHRGARVSGQVVVDGVDVGTADAEQLRRLRGGRIAMIFQDPLSSLDPYFPVGDQIAEVYRAHTGAGRRAARERAVAVLDRVGLPEAAGCYQHQLSGGMRQRALIAMALACEPKVLVADEPTSALDATVQAQILDLLASLRVQTQLALLLITHDLGVAAHSADELLVLRAGQVVERGPARQVLRTPQHAYTRSLLAAVPRVDAPTAVRPVGEPLAEVVDLHRHFRRGVRAVDGVTLDVRRGETLGIVGESGSGKTTLARLLVRLLPPTSGRIVFEGSDIAAWPERRLRPIRRDLQMVFQDPISSLNPRRTVGESIADPLRVHGKTADQQTVQELLDLVGLPAAYTARYPHQLSGGERQRVSIARALALRPKLLVCDEPVSALDVTTQAQVIDLLTRLQRELDLTVVFISHDLAVIRQVSDRVAVMQAGQVVEVAATGALFQTPAHPHTGELLAAVRSV